MIGIKGNKDIFIDYLQEVIAKSGAWRPFQEIMRQSLIPNEIDSPTKIDTPYFSILELPTLCCQAVGGEASIVAPINLAWVLLYTAAHTMDSVEDRDEPAVWWAHLGPAAAINTATGLYASSGLILIELFNSDCPYQILTDILREFHHTILKMCSGQHHEISERNLSLDDYWNLAEAKSGSFFGLGCYAGARIINNDEACTSSFREFGNHLGVIIQISDDTKDFWSSNEQEKINYKNLLNTLPVIYTLSVSSSEICQQLTESLQVAANNPCALSNARGIVESAGAGLYIMAKIEQHRQHAQRALENINLFSPSHDKLMDILNHVDLRLGQ